MVVQCREMNQSSFFLDFRAALLLYMRFTQAGQAGLSTLPQIGQGLITRLAMWACSKLAAMALSFRGERDVPPFLPRAAAAWERVSLGMIVQPAGVGISGVRDVVHVSTKRGSQTCLDVHCEVCSPSRSLYSIAIVTAIAVKSKVLLCVGVDRFLRFVMIAFHFKSPLFVIPVLYSNRFVCQE